MYFWMWIWRLKMLESEKVQSWKSVGDGTIFGAVQISGAIQWWLSRAVQIIMKSIDKNI